MSCHVVSTSTMHRVVAAMVIFGAKAPKPDAFSTPDQWGNDSPTAWGRRMFDMNSRAFAVCYGGRHAADGAAPDYDYLPAPGTTEHPWLRDTRGYLAKAPFAWDAHQMFRAMDEFCYQCDEGEIAQTPLFGVLKAVHAWLAQRLAEHATKHLPWSLEEGHDDPPAVRLPKPATTTRPADPGKVVGIAAARSGPPGLRVVGKTGLRGLADRAKPHERDDVF